MFFFHFKLFNNFLIFLFTKFLFPAILNIAERLLAIEIEYLCLNAEFNPKTKTCVGYGLAGKFLGTRSFKFNGRWYDF